jgi:hypothetical protein
MNTKQICKSLIALVILIWAHSEGMCQTPKAKINYTSFTVNAVKKVIMIDWATDNKVATNYFEIQRSVDGVNFKTIAMVMGPDPKQTNCDCYEGFDKPSTTKHKYFYRLKHVSTDGEVDLSETRMLAINK